MQTTHKIEGDSADDYATYLTSESNRGDYYAGHDGADEPSRWHGSAELLASLELSAEGRVELEELLSLMKGFSPADGRELRPAGGNGTKAAGVDLTFSAPKSVSALWAVSGPERREQIERAHSDAVTSALGRIERDVELLRSRRGGELHWERAKSVLAATFVHTSSRMAVDEEQGGVPDPQLHSHVVVLGAERANGRFAAVDSRELFRSARANGAWYRAELASGLGRLGLEIEGGTGKDARYFEVKSVPQELAERWSARSKDIAKAKAKFRTRYGRDPRGGELGSLTVATRGSKTALAQVDVNDAWRAVAEEYSLTRERAQSFYTGIDYAPAQTLTAEQTRDLGRQLLSDVTKDGATVSERDLHARAYELSAGVTRPGEADRVLDGLVRTGELIELQGGVWTTRELREREQQTLTLAASRAGEQAAPVGEQALGVAQRETGRELGGELSAEQRDALHTITGEGGVSVLVGQAGTGKGVVLSTAADVWRREGYEVIGTAIAGATAERLGADAKLEHALNTSALLAQVDGGRTSLGPNTVVVMDEAGMADTNRLAELVQATAEHESKLVLVGDQAQLSAIGAGGLFKELQNEVPAAELGEVHRANHEWEREAWAQIREGQASEALAAYDQHDQLHLTDTREQAAERMVADWAKAREQNPGERRVMLTDASNAEMDEINARAQAHRTQAGELGEDRAELLDRPYDLRTGDEVIFTAALWQPDGESRVENGTLGKVTEVGKENELKVQTQGAKEREVGVNTSEFTDIRLGYAQHVYKAQGLTTDRAFVLAGSWQTDRERAYVALSRAQERTDIYTSHEDLGEQNMQAGAIERLGELMSESNAKHPSIAIPAVERAQDRESIGERGPAAGTVPPPGAVAGPQTDRQADIVAAAQHADRDQAQEQQQEQESEVGRIMRESHEQRDRERDQNRDLDYGIE